MKYIKLFEEAHSENRIHTLCEKYEIYDYIINSDKSIDVIGDVNLKNLNLTKLPLNFNKVTGNFNISGNKLKTLEGCPSEIGGYFQCKYNPIRNLDNCPKKVGGGFILEGTELTTLIGCPKVVYGSFYISSPYLTSLEGCPEEITGSFYCCRTAITDFKYCPKKVGDIAILSNDLLENIEDLNIKEVESFHCRQNINLTSLKGCPEIVTGDFSAGFNRLKSIQYFPKFVGRQIDLGGNKMPEAVYYIFLKKDLIRRVLEVQEDYGVWNADGSLNNGRWDIMLRDLKEAN